MKPPRWFPAGLAAVASFVAGYAVLVPPQPPVRAHHRPPVVVVPPPVHISPPRRVYHAPPAMPSPYRPPSCVRTPLGHCEVRP